MFLFPRVRTQEGVKEGFARKVPSAKKIFSRKDAKAQRNPLETR
jgi:hypothetical protein